MRGKVSSPGITGAITTLSVPETLKVGSEIRVKVDGSLYNYEYSWYDFWAGCLTAERTGYRDHKIFGGNGQVIGPEWAPTISLGPMPVSSVLITVKLWGNPDYWVSWDWGAQGWVLADTKTVTIVPSGVPPTPPPECDTPGATQCFGADLYTCVAGEWYLTEANSPECEAPPPTPMGIDWKWVALGGGAIVAALIIAGKRR